MKGLFIPDITAEMFRNASLEGIEELMNEGEIYDIDYEPERKKGKWIQPVPRRNVLAYSLAYSECDQCHEVIYLGNEMKYCPNCGADMRGEE